MTSVPAQDAIRWMERLREGDQDALAALVHAFQDELVGYLYRLCWDQLLAEELTQDVFVNIYRFRARYQPTAAVRTFLYRIAHNLWIDHLRKRRGFVSLEREAEQGRMVPDPAHIPDAFPDDALERDALIRRRVAASLDRLSDGQREVFILANSHQMTYQEIAEILAIPEGTVKSRMHHAVHALRAELQDLLSP